MKCLRSALILSFLMGVATLAEAGPSSSGGGNEMIAQFVSFANGLLVNYPWPPEQKTLLSRALRTSRVVVVPVLLDMANGKPVAAQDNLVAWSSEGFIQLKDGVENPHAASWSKMVDERRQLAQQVAHELYRASGETDSLGRSIDDNYQLSIGVYQLDKFTLFQAVEGGPFSSMTGPNSLLARVKNVKPNGRMIYCQDGGSTLAEFLFVETTDNDYVLSLREQAYHGRTLGVVLGDSIDSQFTSTSKGGYLQLSVHIPVTVMNPPSVSFSTCQFSNSSPALLDCTLGGMGKPVLSDGVQEKTLMESQLYFSTAIQSRQTVHGQTQKLVLDYSIYSTNHPFPKGFKNTTEFPPELCAFR